MKILCCYTSLHPMTALSLQLYAPGAEIIDLAYDPQYGYWQEIAKRWTGEEDLVLIEHDTEIHSGVLPSFLECDELWCVYAYKIFRTQVRCNRGLGCTKISAEAQRMTSPAELAETFAGCLKCHGKGCWHHLDARINEVFSLELGLEPHDHGDVIHHHDYSEDLLAEPLPPEGIPIEHWSELALLELPAEVLNFWEPVGPWHSGWAVTGRMAYSIAENLQALAERRGTPIPASTWTDRPQDV